MDGDTSEWGTQVLVEDFNDIVKNSHNVLKYNLYRRKRSEKAPKGKGGFILDSAHNSGNDTVANIQLLVCLPLDFRFITTSIITPKFTVQW